MSEELIQGSPEWLAARAGSLGASQLADALATLKNGSWGASRETLMGTLISERLTGQPSGGFTNAAMEWGTATEPLARAAYAADRDVEVDEIGIVRHSTISHTHASPDGLVDFSGLVEIKCPNTSTHCAFLLGKAIPKKYHLQMMWQMACCDGREWCDFVSFDPRMPEHMQMHAVRVMRDDTEITRLETAVEVFLEELDTKIEALQERFL